MRGTTIEWGFRLCVMGLLTFALIAIREEHPHDLDILVCVVCSGFLLVVSAAMLLVSLAYEIRTSHCDKPEAWARTNERNARDLYEDWYD